MNRVISQTVGQRARRGFTLLELILSLALTAVITGIIGTLIQNYLTNQETGRDSIRQAQMARAILNMIAEDVRTTVRYQAFDTSGLQQLLSSDSGSGASGGGGGGGASGGGASLSGGSSSGGATGGSTTSGATSGAASGGATSSGGDSSSSTESTTVAPLPPGIYGSNTSIEIDVSRLPRPDEYYPKQGNTSTGTLGDMPSDVKTVGYYVQSPRTDGVQDSLGQLSQEAALNSGVTAPPNGGLVRRSVDRAVTQYAYEIGQSDQLTRTGELIASEVLAIEFQYFDGATWQTQWDGSTQGLPQVVKITIAMQRESKAKSNPLDPGFAISSISTSMMQEYGLEVFSTNTIIPGAQLLVAPQGTAASGSEDSGMSSVGL